MMREIVKDLPPEAWQYSIPAALAVVGSAVTGWLTSRKTNKKVDLAVRRTDLAVQQTEPVSNGFTKKVLDTLERLDQGMQRNAMNIDAMRAESASTTVRMDARIDGIYTALIGGDRSVPQPRTRGSWRRRARQ